MKYRPSDKWTTRLACLLCVPLIVACGPPGNTATVSGTVTVDGQPVKKGSIALIPIDGGGPSSGSPIRDGSYSASGWPGKSKVQIYVPKVVGSEKMDDASDGDERVTMAESLPTKYNSQTELEMEVSVGQNEKNWELSIE